MSDEQTPSRQELFNRAYLGLKSQGFEQSMVFSKCAYQGTQGRRCAWGWCDMSLANEQCSVGALKHQQVGLASQMSDEDIAWAFHLLRVHDLNRKPDEMREALHLFAAGNKLTIPADNK